TATGIPPDRCVPCKADDSSPASSPRSSSRLRYHNAYRLGRNGHVKNVATNKPPIIVHDIGPQKAERDKGIMARMAANAVRTTGRARLTVASTIASPRVNPCFTSDSI